MDHDEFHLCISRITPPNETIGDFTLVSSMIVEHAQIPFPNAYNCCEWCATVEQFFDLKMTREDKRGKLLLLSMEGKAFMWQWHYSAQSQTTKKGWQ